MLVFDYNYNIDDFHVLKFQLDLMYLKMIEDIFLESILFYFYFLFFIELTSQKENTFKFIRKRNIRKKEIIRLYHYSYIIVKRKS